MMKKFNLFTIILCFATLLFSSCSSALSVTALKGDDIRLNFSLEFSPKGLNALKDLSNMMGSYEGSSTGSAENQIFSADEVKNFLMASGAKEVSAKNTKDNSIEASALIESLSKTTLAQSKILTKTANSLKLSFGPQELNLFYEFLDEESRVYFDLLMVPCLNGEKMGFTEYRELLSSIYGSDLASELTDGVLKIELKSPDLKKVTRAQLKIGELLTLESSKSWSVSW